MLMEKFIELLLQLLITGVLQSHSVMVQEVMNISHARCVFNIYVTTHQVHLNEISALCA